MDEQSKLEQIGSEYWDKDLLGLNELYHLAMRDQMIAPGGAPRWRLAVGGIMDARDLHALPASRCGRLLLPIARTGRSAERRCPSHIDHIPCML